LFLIFVKSQGVGQFKIRSDEYIQIGYSAYKTLSFGPSANGDFALEYITSGIKGFNIWKPWPSVNYGNYFLFIRDDGGVGIGNNGSSTYRLKVSGKAISSGWYIFSDEKLKLNFKPIVGYNKLLQLETYTYKYKTNNKEITKEMLEQKKDTAVTYDENVHFGFKADEVEKLFPDLVVVDENGIKSVNYIEMIPLLLEIIKQQDTKIKVLEEKIANIQK
jgi:hypothetical protein